MDPRKAAARLFGEPVRDLTRQSLEAFRLPADVVLCLGRFARQRSMLDVPCFIQVTDDLAIVFECVRTVALGDCPEVIVQVRVVTIE